MGDLKFYPYSMGSNGLRFLKKELLSRGVSSASIKRFGSSYSGSRQDIVINWGNGVTQPWVNKVGHIYNPPGSISNATNKLKFFKTIGKQFPKYIPEFTTSMTEAKKWASNDIIFCRKHLSGSRGSGIVVALNSKEVVPAPLYTKGIQFDAEYRIHVFNNKIIDLVRKFYFGEDTSPLIRNLENGWNFIRKGLNLSKEAEQISIKMCSALGLDFCAFDVIVSGKNYYFLEANTAPGMRGLTTIKYADAIESIVS